MDNLYTATDDATGDKLTDHCKLTMTMFWTILMKFCLTLYLMENPRTLKISLICWWWLPGDAGGDTDPYDEKNQHVLKGDRWLYDLDNHDNEMALSRKLSIFQTGILQEYLDII